MRLVLPAKFRPEFEGGLVVTKGQDRCLFAFKLQEFDRITGLLASATVTRVRDYSRVFFASASHEVPDGQGRISIPYPLRSYAGLIRGNECVIIGANTRIEIWAPDVWQEWLESMEQYFAVAESIVPGV